VYPHGTKKTGGNMTGLRRAAAGIRALEEYALKDSALSQIHPQAKLAGTAIYIVCVASFPAAGLSALVPYVLYFAVLLPLSDIPVMAVAKRLVPVLPFALMGGIGNLIFMKEPAFVFGEVIISKGVVSFAAIMLKAVFCAASVLILIGSTPFHVICAELRRLHVPAVFCVQLAMMYRYIAVLLEEASSMYTAYMLRAAGKQKAVNLKDMGPLLGHLVLRSMDKAGRVYNAMKCRGWTGIFYVRRQKIKVSDYLYCVSVCGSSILFRFFNIPRFFGNLVRDGFVFHA
jgi:cobalt/nickel transport system permease protein